MLDNSQIQNLAEKFDQAWRSGEQPSLEELVASVSESSRPSLLKRLVPIDIDHRRRAAEAVNAEDYLAYGADAKTLAESELIESDQTDDKLLPTTPKPRRIGPYTLLRQIGEGGMGSVWMAEQKTPIRRRVALKLIRPAIATENVIARFEVERQALAMMDHPNIAKVLDAGTTEDGGPFFVMELIEGTPLHQYCDENELSIGERLGIMAEICEAVQHAHQKGVIHRDLKPSNVLVAEVDYKPTPKVIDFGLAKATEHTAKLTDKTMFTEFGKVVGTLQYMSPEQAGMGSLDIDTRTDIYSLGVMLYELLAGSTPLGQNTLCDNALHQVLELIRDKVPPRPSTRLSSAENDSDEISRRRKIATSKLQSILKGELDWIVMKAIEKNRDRRYQSAGGFADDIHRFINGDPVVARPPSALYQLQKYIKKNKGWFASVATIVALVLASLAALIVMASYAIGEAEKAKQAQQDAEARSAELKRSNYNFTLSRANTFLKTNAGLALPLLEDEESCPVALREATWNFLYHRARQDHYRVDAHVGGVKGIACSPAGEHIATCGNDGLLKIWKAQTGETLCDIRCAGMNVRRPKFSCDGKLLAAVHGETLSVWEVETGKLQKSVENVGPVNPFFFDKQSRIRLAYVSEKESKILSFEKGEQIPPEIDWRDLYLPEAVLWNDDGKLFVGMRNGDMRLVDDRTGRMIREIGKHEGWVSQLCLSANGQRLASREMDGRIVIRDLKTNLPIFKTKGAVVPAWTAFSRDGNRLAVKHYGGLIEVWDIEANASKSLQGHTGEVICMCFSPDGNSLYSGSNDGTMRAWREFTPTAGEGELVKEPTVVDFDFDTESKLYLLNKSGEVSVHDPAGKELQRIPTGLTVNLISVAQSNRIAVGSETAVYLLDESRPGKISFCDNGLSWCHDIKYTADGKHVLYISEDKFCQLNVQTQKTVWRAAPGSHHLHCVTSSLGGTNYAAGSREGDVVLFAAKGFQREREFLHHDNYVRCLGFSSSGKLLASAGSDRSVVLTDVEHGQSLRTLRAHSAEVLAVGFMDEDQTLVSCDAAGMIVFWDTSSGQQRLRFDCSDFGIRKIDISPDGKTIAGLGTEGVHLWDVSDLISTGNSNSNGSPNDSSDTSVDLTTARNEQINLAQYLEKTVTLNDCIAKVENEMLATDWLSGVPGRGCYLSTDNGKQIFLDGFVLSQLAEGEAKNLDQELSGLKIQVTGRVTNRNSQLCILVAQADDIQLLTETGGNTSLKEHLRKRSEKRPFVSSTPEKRNLMFCIHPWYKGIDWAFANGEESIVDLVRFAREEKTFDRKIDPLVRLMLAETLITNGHPGEAVPDILQAIQAGGATSCYPKSLCWAYLADGNTKAAKETVSKSFSNIDVEAKSTDAGKLDGADELTSAFLLGLIDEETYLDRRSDESGDAWFYIGQRREIEQRNPAALKAYNEVTKIPVVYPWHRKIKAWAQHRIKLLKADQ